MIVLVCSLTDAPLPQFQRPTGHLHDMGALSLIVEAPLVEDLFPKHLAETQREMSRGRRLFFIQWALRVVMHTLLDNIVWIYRSVEKCHVKPSVYTLPWHCCEKVKAKSGSKRWNQLAGVVVSGLGGPSVRFPWPHGKTGNYIIIT